MVQSLRLLPPVQAGLGTSKVPRELVRAHRTNTQCALFGYGSVKMILASCNRRAISDPEFPERCRFVDSALRLELVMGQVQVLRARCLCLARLRRS